MAESECEPRAQIAPALGEGDGRGGRYKEVESQLFSWGLGLPGVPLQTPSIPPSATLCCCCPRALPSCEGGQHQPWRHMKGPRLLWEPALHSGTPSHGNVSKSQFDPISSVCSHSQFPPPAPWTAVCCSQPEVCGVPAAPEAGTPLPHFPWIHSQQTQASPPHLTGLPATETSTDTGHQRCGGAVSRPHLSSPFK